jgi:poly(beta-D-mannuronate) lyase
MKNRLLTLLASLVAVTASQAETYYANDFESDTVGEQPAGNITFSPSSNTATNGAVIVDDTSTPANPLTGQSLYVYDLSGDGSTGDPTNMRFAFNGGTDVSNLRVDFNFQRAYASASDDTDTKILVAVGRNANKDKLNNSDFRPFELRIQNRGKIEMNSRDGSSTVADYLTDAPNALTLMLNSHDTESVAYDDETLGTGTLAPNTVTLFLNGSLVGAYPFHQTPDPTNAPEIDFYAENNDLGAIAFYRDSKNQGGIVFDNLIIDPLETAPPPPAATVYYENDFESETVGEQPAGTYDFRPDTNTATNGSVVVDGTSTPANPLPGQSLYVYDLSGDGSTGENTRFAFDFNGGTNVSNLRVDFDFQRAYAAANPDDSDTRILVAVGRVGDNLTNSDFRPFELRLQNRGKIQMNSMDGTSTVADYLTDTPNAATLLLNSHDTESVPYDDETLGSGSLAPNTISFFLNGSLVGTYPFHQTPDPDNAPQIDFYAEDNDLGQIAFYQDSKRQGGIVFDNLKISSIEAAAPPPVSEIYFEADYEKDTVGEQPGGGYTFSPGSNTATNGAVVVDDTSDPANPLTGQSLYIYDLSGDLSSGDPTHTRRSFNNGQNVSNVRVDFDFQRAYASTTAEDEDTRVHFAVARAGDKLNNSDFRPFEIRILNNGNLVVNSIAGSANEGPYLTDAPNHLSLLINSHDTNSVDYDDEELGTGTVAPNNLHVFLNNSLVGTYVFHQTPDPTNAPQIDFYAEDNDLGQFAFYQDSKRQGGIVFDNLVIKSLKAQVEGLDAPTDLSATANSAVQVSLTWTDNADGEDAYVVERKSGMDDFAEIAELDANAEAYTDDTVLPETIYTYRVKATTSKVESEPSNEAEVTTPEQVEPLIVGTEVPELVVSGDDATVSVDSLGREPLSYKWYTGSTGDTSAPIDGTTGSSLTLTGLQDSVDVWVRVTNASGISDSDTIEVNVHTPVTITVTSESELEDAIAAALPGDTILMKNGTWSDIVIHLTGEGTEAHPITLGAETAGSVILTGESRVEIGGSWLVLQDLSFEGFYSGNDDEVIQFRRGSGNLAYNCRVTNISMVDYYPESGEKTVWVSFYGTDNRLDHSYFKGHDVIGVTVIVWLDGKPNDHRIDHNHFADRKSGGGENGWETIRIGTSTNSMTVSRTTVDYNLFTRVDGEMEIISNKSGENVYRYNTFRECQGTLTLRHGNDCIVDSNTFLGMGREGTGGVRVIGEDHLVINNYFHGTTARDGAAITVYAGVPDSPLNEYFAAHGATIAFNTFVDNQGALIEIGAGYGERDRTVLPTGITVANNLMADTTNIGYTCVIGENATDQTWKTNLVHNRKIGIEVEGGFVTDDPKLVSNLTRQLVIPGIDGAAADAAATGILTLATDIEGRGRDAMPDIGSHEVMTNGTPARVGPVSTVDTGPSFLGPNRDPDVPNLRLANNSTRAISNTGENLLINGFVVTGTGYKTVLVRAVGPGLAAYGITDPMPEPVLKLHDTDSEIARNAGWQTGPEADLIEASAVAGAFPLVDGSLDSALLVAVPAGPYTAQVVPAEGTVGTVLVEVYDITTSSGTMTNQSSRGFVGAGQEFLITGIVVTGAEPRQVLIRGAGPALTDLGVNNAVADPILAVFDSEIGKIGENDNWSDSSNATEIADTTATVGAFPFADGSGDSAILMTLEPGVYTARIAGVAGATGVTLVEVYLVD